MDGFQHMMDVQGKFENTIKFWSVDESHEKQIE